ncbi:alpha/beta hydrolase-fold protein [Thalassotalea fusca]
MIRILTIFILLTVCSWNSAIGEEIVIGESETLHSKVLNEKRLIFVSLPEGYEENDYSYPVLYFTDAEAHFEIMVSTVNFLRKSNIIPPIILVGIQSGANRTRDLTPRVFNEEDKKHPWFQSVEYGGANKFLTFIEQELLPHVDKKYRTADFRVFSGHSFGGLFSIYAYVNKPELFDGFMAISPSLGWDDERIVKEAKQKIEQNALPKKSIYISKGSEQGTTAASYKSIMSLFEKNTSYPITSQEFPEESHLTVVFDAQFHGLKAIFNEWELPYVESAKGLGEVKAHNKNVKEAYKIDFTSESWLINLGNSLYYKKNYDSAIEAYEYNISLFPSHAYSYFQLAKTYEEKKEHKLARINYEKANKLVPTTSPYKEIYEKAVQKIQSEE